MFSGPGLPGFIKVNNEIVFTIGAVDNIKSPFHRYEVFLAAGGADEEFLFLLNFHRYDQSHPIAEKLPKIVSDHRALPLNQMMLRHAVVPLLGDDQVVMDGDS